MYRNAEHGTRASWNLASLLLLNLLIVFCRCDVVLRMIAVAELVVFYIACYVLLVSFFLSLRFLLLQPPLSRGGLKEREPSLVVRLGRTGLIILITKLTVRCHVTKLML